MNPINKPIKKEYFLENYFEKKPCVFKGVYDTKFIDQHEIEDIFNRSDLMSFEGIKLMYNGILDKSEYIESYSDLGIERHRYIYPKLYDYINSGATLVANGVINEPKIDFISKYFASLTNSQAFSSIYLAYGDKGSFKSHWDSRDIFVVQLTGKKRWVIYEPSFTDPLFIHRSVDMENTYPCSSEPYSDIVLEEGDVLYLPRGWWHNPLPIGEETIHLSVGVFPPFIHDYLSWFFNRITDFDIGRKSLSGSWDDAKNKIKELSEFIELQLSSEDIYNEFMQSFNAEKRVASKLNLDLFCNGKKRLQLSGKHLRINSNNNLSINSGYIICNGTKLYLDPISLSLLKIIDENYYILYDDLMSYFNNTKHKQLEELIYKLSYQDILEIVNG